MTNKSVSDFKKEIIELLEKQEEKNVTPFEREKKQKVVNADILQNPMDISNLTIKQQVMYYFKMVNTRNYLQFKFDVETFNTDTPTTDNERLLKYVNGVMEEYQQYRIFTIYNSELLPPLAMFFKIGFNYFCHFIDENGEDGDDMTDGISENDVDIILQYYKDAPTSSTIDFETTISFKK